MRGNGLCDHATKAVADQIKAFGAVCHNGFGKCAYPRFGSARAGAMAGQLYQVPPRAIRIPQAVVEPGTMKPDGGRRAGRCFRNAACPVRGIKLTF